MHFITGGAFNGKRSWVKKTYIMKKSEDWISAYDLASLPIDLEGKHDDLVVLEGIEVWIKELIEIHEPDQTREIWNQCLTEWEHWEQAETQRRLVIIGTDVTKGIVPIEKQHRIWRDAVGWLYQDLAARAEKVDVIWYGLNQTLKGGNNE
ncbi:bifunctional adenosylcobinamide kinase/adenosylcobinamide-phosphate guanylyltransferase [Neobacillus sp. Marseille-QA0830]